MDDLVAWLKQQDLRIVNVHFYDYGDCDDINILGKDERNPRRFWIRVGTTPELLADPLAMRACCLRAFQQGAEYLIASA